MAQKIKKNIKIKNNAKESIIDNNEISFIKKEEYKGIYSFKIQAIIISIISFVFYCNTFSNSWAYDDLLVILQNEYVQSGFSGIPKILMVDAFESYTRSQNEESNQLTGGRYRPLSLITFAAEQQFFGLDRTNFSDTTKAGQAKAYQIRKNKLDKDMHIRHIINVLLYLLSVIALLYLLRKIVLKDYPLAAFLATLIFAIHPIHTEVVANVKSRDEILSLLFICTTFIMSFKYLESKKIKDLIFAICAYFLALLSKEYAVALVFLLPFSFYYFKNYSIKQSIIKSLIYFIPLILYFILRTSAVKPTTEITDGDVMNNPYILASFIEKQATEIFVLFNYIKLLFFPHPLAVDYTFNQIPYVDFSNLIVWVSLIIHTGLIYWMFKLIKKRLPIGFALVFYFTFLLLISNIFVNVGSPMGERLIYHSSVGFAIIIGYLLYIGYTKIKHQITANWLLFGAMAIIIGASGFKTFTRNKDWQCNSVLFLKDVQSVPNSVIVNSNAGTAWDEISVNTEDPAKKKEAVLNAIKYMSKAISINNRYMSAYANRALAYTKIGEMDKALSDYDTILKYYPTYPSIPVMSNTLALYYVNLGLTAGKENRFEDAILNFRKCTQAAPNNPDFWYNLGFAYCNNKQYPEGKRALENALRLNPNHGPAKNILNQLNGIKILQ